MEWFENFVRYLEDLSYVVFIVGLFILPKFLEYNQTKSKFLAERDEQIYRTSSGTSIGVKKGIQELLTDPNIIKVLNSGVSINVQISPDGTQNIIIGGYNNSVNRYLNNI